MVAVARILSLTLAAALVQPQHANAQVGDEVHLTALARAAVETQNDILVSGDVQGSLGKRANAAAFRGGIERHLPTITNRRNALARARVSYRSHQTTLRVTNTRVEGNRATQTAVERVVLALPPIPGAPAETVYEQPHIFRYEKEGGEWTLVADELPPPLEDPDSLRGPARTPRTVDAPAGYEPNPQLQERNTPGPSSFLNGGEMFSLAAMGSRSRWASSYATYSPSAAVNYAYTYWSNYNSSYRAYSNDCTNFISQVVRAGGWPFDEVGERTTNNAWYYGLFTWTTTYSWAGAHNFNLFFAQSGRGSSARYFSDLRTGDLLQADFGPSPDGNIEHSMIVTKKDSYGNLYLTYHTNNTRDRLLSDIRTANPGTNWYGLVLKYSF
jgi:hypothetical protein